MHHTFFSELNSDRKMNSTDMEESQKKKKNSTATWSIIYFTWTEQFILISVYAPETEKPNICFNERKYDV
jgi:hypothetical protein